MATDKNVNSANGTATEATNATHLNRDVTEIVDEADLKGDVENFTIDHENVPLETLVKYADMERELEEHEHQQSIGNQGQEPERVEELISRLGLDDELRAAYRAMRTTGWFKLFSLICTDVLGPQTTPWTVSQMGYAPGIVLYVVFGVTSLYTGLQMSYMYLKLSSSRFPMSTFSDLPTRIIGGYWGRVFRIGIFLLQTVQFIFFVSGPILTNAQSISQMAHGKGCYVTFMVAISAFCLIVNQIRSLHQLGRVTIFNVVINFLVLFAAMGVMAHSPPNYDAAASLNQMPIVDKTVRTYAIAPTSFKTKLIAISNMCYAYTANIMLIEFHNEVKTPKRNFWKGLVSALVAIMGVYILYGVYVYSQQGQFCVNPANQGLSIYSWQTAINGINLAIGSIASILYANIGLKVIYYYLVHEIFRGPEMVTRKGRYIWIGMSIFYYIIAFIVAAAVPQLNNISGFFGAISLVPFTYTIPPLLMIILRIRLSAMKANCVWPEISRMEWWKRVVIPLWYLTLVDLCLFCASIVIVALGAWSTIDGMIQAFKAGAPPPFSCRSPFSS